MNEETTTSPAPQPEPAYRLVIAPFDDEEGAARALAQVLAARREKRVAVPAVAAVRKDATGAVDINEPGDVGAKEGAVAGGLVGGLLGSLLGRKPLVGAALGAALGAVGAEKHDAGIPNPRLQEIGDGLPAGSSALVAIVPESEVARLRALLGMEAGRMSSEPIALDLDVARQLSAGQYGEAVDSLATQAEGLIGEVEARLAEAAGSITKKSGGAEVQGSRAPGPAPVPDTGTGSGRDRSPGSGRAEEQGSEGGLARAGKSATGSVDAANTDQPELGA